MIEGRYSDFNKKYLCFLTHIDYDITVISDEQLKASGEFLPSQTNHTSSIPNRNDL